jgi:KUP system potassium uptake protein
LVPPALLSNLRYNDSLHETVVLVSVITVDQPHVTPAQRPHIRHLPAGFHQLVMRYGFADRPQLTKDLQQLLIEGVNFDEEHTNYFLGRERLTIEDRPGMAAWRDRLFIFLHRNASDPSVHFGLPPDRTVDIGTHVGI